ncbi:Asp-tRNA(Asn)/Glu-tRNA(Gln) amidotransferase subunit GatB [Candidatus Pacearchaeota archaeon]|nr:Asp-tRNA(Asn)/Glu-tRNA(Gln) amidotransferase subunit GatB [Candidatus Pacearchaeota archaeon]
MEQVKIGLEIHGYLVTKEKLFCENKTDYKQVKPNTNICPICCGYPGARPMLPNETAVGKVIEIALMLGCKISQLPLIWQRKHYDWPDLPKGYQETVSGAYSVPVGSEGKFLGIGIREVHIEEDPARWDPETGRVDFNRSGLPLVEIVTEPDFKTSESVREWLHQIIITLSYIKALDKDAGIKADVNVSVGQERVEIKNINSIYSIVQAIEAETKRQIEEIKKGKQIKRETRAYNEKRKTTLLMREKEEQADYRFIPDPDLPILFINRQLVEEIQKKLPELPHLKAERFKKEHDVQEKVAKVLSSNKELAEFYEKVVKLSVDKKLTSYWVTIELLRVLNWNKKSLPEVQIKPEHFAELLKLIEEKKITEAAAKQMLNEFVPKSFSPSDKLKKVERISDEGEIKKVCEEILKKEKKAVEDYKQGEEKALNFLIGQVMKETRGRADITKVKEILLKLIK